MYQTEFLRFFESETKVLNDSAMCFHFAAEIKDLKNLEVQSYLYFFLTDKQPNETDGYIKFGITTQDISDRLRQYKDTKITNIYYISTDKIERREHIILNIYRLANSNLGCHIWHHKKREYYRGDLSLLKRIFFYIASMDSSLLKEFSSISDIDVIISKLKQIDEYNIKYNKDIDTEEDTDEDNEHKEEETISKVNNISEVNNTEENQCPKCGKQCRDKRGVTIHLKKCGDIKEFICDACDAEFTAHNSLLVHYGRCKVLKQRKQEEELKIHTSKLIEEKQKIIDKLQYQNEQLLIENKKLKYQLQHSIPNKETINAHMSILWNKCSKMLSSQMEELINETIQDIND